MSGYEQNSVDTQESAVAARLQLLHTFCPGQRLSLARTGEAPGELGLGTHLWGGDILLDNGTKVQAGQCEVAEVEDCPVPPFEIVLQKPAQVYSAEGGVLRMTRHWIHDGERLRVLALDTRPWNHGSYVAGKIRYRGAEYWLIMSQVSLPSAF